MFPVINPIPEHEEYFKGVYQLIYRGKYQQLLNYLRKKEKNNQLPNNEYLAIWYYFLGRSFIALGNRPQGIQHYNNALDLARQLKFTSLESALKVALGYFYKNQNELDVAQQHFEEVINLKSQVKNQISYISALEGIASIHIQQGLIEIAETQLYQILELKKQINDQLSIAMAMNLLATVYRKQGKRTKALVTRKSIVPVYEQTENQKLLINLYTNLGIDSLGANRIKEAISYHNKALMLGKQSDNNFLISISLIHLGELYHLKGNLEDAIKVYLEAINLQRECDNQYYLGLLMIYMGCIYGDLNELIKAKKSFEQAFTIFKELNYEFFSAWTLAELRNLMYKENVQFDYKFFQHKFPLPPYDRPEIIFFKYMIKAIEAQENHNWGKALLFWQKCLELEHIKLVFQLRSKEALIDVAFNKWQIDQTIENEKDLNFYLQSFQQHNKANELPNIQCKLLLTRAKISLGKLDLNSAEVLLKEALQISKKRKLKILEKNLKNELMNLKLKKEHLIRQFGGNNNLRLLPARNINNLKLDKESVGVNQGNNPLNQRQIVKILQKNQIIELLESNPTGFQQKYIASKIGLSHSTVSRRVSELIDMGTVIREPLGNRNLLRIVY